MSGENVVEILVKATDGTKAGFAESKASSEGAAAGMDAYAEAVTRATGAETEFRAAQAEAETAQARLDDLQASGSASADELAAAQDRVTEASLRSMDAQVRLGEADLRVAAASRTAGDAAEGQAAKADTAGGMMAGAGGKVKMALLGVAVGAALAVKSAGDFQTVTTRLVTSAGEQASQLGLVQRGILSLSVSTNTSATELAKGMYMIESAGFHGADGLAVLKASAQGAAAEGADLATVGNAVTTVLNAYGMKASSATSVTNQMVTAVGQGKMTMQDLASSISSVLPIAAAAHISFAQVGGAVATMTSQGMSAQQATQDLANSVRALLNPNAVAINEMQQFGISSTDVSQHLGSRGLTGTIDMLAETIAKRMGPSGLVMLSTFNQSKTAAADAETMLRSLPASIRGVAEAYLNGSISQKTWTADLKAMPPLTANLAREFATVADKADGFNDLLKSGNPDAQTFAAALGKMMGGATGLNTALMLTGSHTATFDANVKAVGDSAAHAGSNVKGWSDIQGTFNYRLGSAEKAVQATGIALGTALLPAVTAILGPIAKLGEVIAQNKVAAVALGVVVGAVLAGAIGSKLAGALSSTKGMVTSFGDAMGWLAGKLGLTAVAEEEAAVAGTEMDAAMDANPIGLIILALAALIVIVIEVIKHWHQIADAAKEAFRAVTHAVEEAFDWVKAHWPLLLEILTGPIGFAAVFIIKHWNELADVAKAVFKDVTRAVSEAFDWVKSHWPLLLGILTGPIGLAVLYIVQHWHQIVAGAQQMGNDVISFFQRLPGRILGALGDLASMLWNAGVNAIQGLLGGLGSMVGSAISTVAGWGHDIVNALGAPFGIHFSEPSEATKMIAAGKKIPMGLAAGMLSGTSVMAAAAARLAGAAALGAGGGRPGYGGYGGAASGGQLLTIRLEWAGGGDDPLFKLIRQGVRIRGGDVQAVLGWGAAS